MPIARFQMPDGRIGRFEVPEGTTPEQAQKMIGDSLSSQPKKQETTIAQDVKQGAGNTLAGLVRGAGSIGATLLAPVDMAKDAMAGKGFSLESNRQRRADMDSALGMMGAETNSFGYGAGKLVGEVAGTAGAGGALANGTRMGLAMAGKAVPTAIEPVLSAIASGGFSTGSKVAPGVVPFLKNQGVRALGGAVSGGASAGLVNPEDSPTGLLVGGALPGVVKVAGEAGKLTGKAISGLTKNTLGMTTGAGAETFSTAYRAGKEGGTSFLDNMRGNVPMTDVLDSAKDALSKMRIDRGNQYRSGMVDIAKDKSVINFAPIESAVNSLKTMGSFKGQVINKNAAGTVDEVAGLVNQWKGLDPAEFHTPEGLDALKKAIGDIRDATQFGTPGRKAADTAYNSVKAQIDLQAPTYAKVMRDYSEASNALTEVERALSLGNKAAADTSMRKLQSLMRNNVNTNYGNRLDLAKSLEARGADILPAVAGQAASSFTPRGLQGLAATGAGFASMANPMTLAALPFTSPRLMGEAAYGLGALRRGVGSVAGKAGSATRLIPRAPNGLLDMEQYAPLLTTAPVIHASQR
jgi:hypothetical protein